MDIHIILYLLLHFKNDASSCKFFAAKSVSLPYFFTKYKLIAILSGTQINANNREKVKSLAVKSLIKRNIKESELKKRNVFKYNANQLNSMIKNTSRKLNVNEEGLKRILETNNLSYESQIK